MGGSGGGHQRASVSGSGGGDILPGRPLCGKHLLLALGSHWASKHSAHPPPQARANDSFPLLLVSESPSLPCEESLL